MRSHLFRTGLCVLFLPACGNILNGPREPLLQTGQVTLRETPDASPGTAVSVVSGRAHTCALFQAGNVRCWGQNENGDLGYGHNTPVGDDEDPASAGDVALGCPAVALAAGAAHTCALCESGTVRCWGSNAFGQLGEGHTRAIGDNESPAEGGEVFLGSPAKQVVAGGEHSCALLADGTVQCWGRGTEGQLGYGRAQNLGDDDRFLAGTVNVGGTVVQLAAGENHTCALLLGGSVRCWGEGAYGAMGRSNRDRVGATQTPSSVGDLPLGGRATWISSSHRHVCAVLDTGGVRCWGENLASESGFQPSNSIVGDDETPEQMGDARVTGRFDRVLAGWKQTCAREQGGNQWICWGANPQVPYGVDLLALSAGQSHWCGVNASGNIRCVGEGAGRLGYPHVESVALWPEKSVSVQGPLTLSIDPLVVNQWHLRNSGQLGGVVGIDAGVFPVWQEGNRGDGILLAVVDDGLSTSHPDLFPNVLPGASFNYLDGSTNPGGRYAMHGTCVGGILAARDDKPYGVRGVAPRARLAGYNLLQNATLANMVDAMTRNQDAVYASNNSWGPPDGVGMFYAPLSLWRSAVEKAVLQGRGGKGVSFFWAAGNGAISATDKPTDLSTYDGYANHWAVTAVCAVGDDGKAASYSEPGANLWVCGPSEGNSGTAITTTDLVGPDGYNRSSPYDYADRAYTRSFNGTSASTPMVAGVAALVYRQNPKLGWRDLRGILARSAQHNDASSDGWQVNGAGFPVHYDYGFGLVNAEAAVELAKTWQPVANLATADRSTAVFSQAIADGGTAEVVLDVQGSGVAKIEFVEVEVGLKHGDWGNLEITLERPDGKGTSSVLALPHSCFDSPGYNQSPVPCFVSGNRFQFSSARHLGEPADGTWKLVVRDGVKDSLSGTLNRVRVKFYGEAP